MKKEIKFSINESLHSELQAIVENKKTDENQLIEGIISDFITKLTKSDIEERFNRFRNLYPTNTYTSKSTF